MEPTYAACYIRVSTEEQTEYSPEAQQRALGRYAQQHGLTILPEHIYLDAGISGRRAETRPAFMAMVAAAKQKPPPFSVILVHKFDRFARNREDSIVYKSMLRRQCGVQVVSITEHLEDDRMSLILEAMLEAMAEYYSINLGDEVRKGMAEKARRGELQTVPPFGYRAVNNTLVPIPQEADAVREIYRQFLAGASMASIARWTQRTGILTHRGNPMNTRQIRYILSNPAYIGKLRWHTGHDGPPIAVEGHHAAILDAETFREADQLLRANAARYGRHARPAGDRKHWLAGLVRCATCGGGLIFAHPHYLKCGRYAKGICSTSQHIPAARLEEALLTALRADAACQTAFSATPLPQSDQTRNALKRELDAAERKLLRLRDAFLNGADTLEEYTQAKHAFSARAEELRQALSTADSQSNAHAAALQQRLQRALTTLDDPEANVEAKHRAAASVLERCTWSKQEGSLSLLYRLTL